MHLFTAVQKYKHSDDIFKVLFLNRWKPSATRLVPVHSTAKEDATCLVVIMCMCKRAHLYWCVSA
jgi:hypothetical protein